LVTKATKSGLSTSLSDTGEDVVGAAVIKLCTGALLGDFVGSDEGGTVNLSLIEGQGLLVGSLLVGKLIRPIDMLISIKTIGGIDMLVSSSVLEMSF
jgi:hypothetical protein